MLAKRFISSKNLRGFDKNSGNKTGTSQVGAIQSAKKARRGPFRIFCHPLFQIITKNQEGVISRHLKISEKKAEY